MFLDHFRSKTFARMTRVILLIYTNVGLLAETKNTHQNKHIYFIVEQKLIILSSPKIKISVDFIVSTDETFLIQVRC